nr:PhM00017.1 [Neoporphyra haitanensis]
MAARPRRQGGQPAARPDPARPRLASRPPRAAAAAPPSPPRDGGAPPPRGGGAPTRARSGGGQRPRPKPTAGQEKRNRGRGGGGGGGGRGPRRRSRRRGGGGRARAAAAASGRPPPTGGGAGARGRRRRRRPPRPPPPVAAVAVAAARRPLPPARSPSRRPPPPPVAADATAAAAAVRLVGGGRGGGGVAAAAVAAVASTDGGRRPHPVTLPRGRPWEQRVALIPPVAWAGGRDPRVSRRRRGTPSPARHPPAAMPPPAGVDVAALAATAAALCRPGRGILASDESTGTLGARLARAGVTNTEANRRAYRELFYTAPAIEAGLSGAILFHEAVYQADASGTGFVDGLRAKGIIVGVKVDRGLVPLLPGGGGGAAAAAAAAAGGRGRRDRDDHWRCLLVIDAAAGLPSAVAVADNAAGLARYAVTAQAAGLVPIIEPEITIDGGHSAEAAAAVTERVLSVVYATLATYGVALEGTLLKPQMVLPGVAHPDFASIPPAEVARLTLRALRRTVPPAVPGVMFLSGGQSEARATACLNAINLAARGGVPGGGAHRRRALGALVFVWPRPPVDRPAAVGGGRYGGRAAGGGGAGGDQWARDDGGTHRQLHRHRPRGRGRRLGGGGGGGRARRAGSAADAWHGAGRRGGPVRTGCVVALTARAVGAAAGGSSATLRARRAGRGRGCDRVCDDAVAATASAVGAAHTGCCAAGSLRAGGSRGCVSHDGERAGGVAHVG